jgi:hypothetical protein
MRQTSNPSVGIVENDGYTAPQPDRDQHVAGDTGTQLGYPHYDFAGTHAARR